MDCVTETMTMLHTLGFLWLFSAVSYDTLLASYGYSLLSHTMICLSHLNNPSFFER